MHIGGVIGPGRCFMRRQREPRFEKVGEAASPLCWPQWIRPLGLVSCLDSRDMATHVGI